MRSTAGKYIGKYQIRSRLGQGAMGHVYKVHLPGGPGFAALKELKPGSGLITKMGMKWIYDRFIHEYTVIAGLNHPNVVTVWNLEESGGHVYFLMEYFARNLGVLMGESYFADRPSRILKIEKAVKYVLEALEGLSGLHHEGIVHQDIKPFNLMLTENDTIKITDFGLSGRRGEKFTTPSQLMVGTPYYAAPEQLNTPEKTEPPADLYSVGVMFFRMLTGTLPQKPFKKPSSFNPELDETWDELIFKSIHYDPNKRFQTAESMIDEIRTRYQEFVKQKQMDCSISFDVSARTAKKGSPGNATIRSEPDKVLAKRAKSVFQIDECHRPEQYLENDFERANSDVIVDRNTHLAWQQAGSKFPLQWEQAKQYITGLNSQRFGGYENWRLPTVSELLSLLNPPPPGEDFCFQSPFSFIQKWIWSGDTRSKRAAWFVDVEMGFVASADILDFYFIKAVCAI